MPTYLVDVDVSTHVVRTYSVWAATAREAEQNYHDGELVGESNVSDEIEEVESCEETEDANPIS